jgi:hypothetical protein
MMSPIAVSRLVAWSRSCRDGVTGGLRCKSQDPGITLQLLYVTNHITYCFCCQALTASSLSNRENKSEKFSSKLLRSISSTNRLG